MGVPAALEEAGEPSASAEAVPVHSPSEVETSSLSIRAGLVHERRPRYDHGAPR
ncbi:Hypothetical protein A7982_06076 [Minicystis rosea]|nr:Hypothetical protein A7982_06076 [Minicystis rosea]